MVNARYWIPSTSGETGAIGEFPYLRGLKVVRDQGLKCQCSIHTCKLSVYCKGKQHHGNATRARWHLCLPKLPQQLPRDKVYPPPLKSLWPSQAPDPKTFLTAVLSQSYLLLSSALIQISPDFKSHLKSHLLC